MKSQQLSELGTPFRYIKIYRATYKLLPHLDENVAVRVDVVAPVGAGNTND